MGCVKEMLVDCRMLVTKGTWERTYKESNVKCCYQAQNVQDQSIPAAKDTKYGFIWKLCLEMSLGFPRMPESDMRKTDRCPNEEEREARKCQQPIEDNILLIGLPKKGK